MVALSLILSGRNDNYMGNFTYRLATCLNYIAHGAAKINRLDDTEIVVTDWNSDVPLAEDLPISAAAAQITRFVVVPPQLAQSVQLPEQVFFPACAVNTAIRRARGEFIVLINADLLIPHYSLQILLDLVDGKLDLPWPADQTFFCGGRHHIPWQVSQRSPSVLDWDRYLLMHGAQLPLEQGHPGLGTHLSAQMMHRDLWLSSGSYNEQYRYWGWSDAELTLRITQLYPWLHLSTLGVQLYDMEHWVENKRAPVDRNPYTVSPTYEIHQPGWGLSNYVLDIQTAKRIVEPQPPTPRGAIAPWAKTQTEILTEMTGDKVTEHIQNIQQMFSLELSDHDYDIFYPLAWYSLYYYPRTYLDFGAKWGYTAALVTAAQPSVEFYGIESWQEDSGYPVPYHATNMFFRVGYRGYARFVSGDPQTALARLQASCIGSLKVDLACVRADLLADGALALVKQLIDCLEPGGAIVLTSESSGVISHIWQACGQQFPQFTYIKFAHSPTGLILAATFIQ